MISLLVVLFWWVLILIMPRRVHHKVGFVLWAHIYLFAASYSVQIALLTVRQIPPILHESKASVDHLLYDF